MKTKARKIVPPSCMRLWCGEACQRLSLALILMMLCSMGAWAQSNSCGDGLTYSLSNDNKTLTISKTGEGTGAMSDYQSNSDRPWNSFKDVITNVVINDGVTTIGRKAFDNFDALTSVTFPSSVTSIGRDAFYSCGSLTSVTIPNNVTSIGNAAFQYCENLTAIVVPDALESIGANAFDNTAWKTNLLNGSSQSDGVVYLGKVAYTYKGIMPENSDIALAANTKGIAGGAFNGQDKLASITIPNSVTNIGNSAFIGCSNLTTITVDNDNANYSSVDGVLFNKAKTTLITCPQGKSGSYSIPNSVTNINHDAFYGCSGLTSVTIPNTVTTIGEWVFYNCSLLESITIPSSVTGIGSGAFQACNSLTTVYVMATTPPTLGSYVFNSYHPTPTIYVPNSSYTTATNWSEYASKIEVLSITASGYCGVSTINEGHDVSWTLYGNGMLVISGNGAMANYSTHLNLPWYNYGEQIISVVIENGVTSIGSYAFALFQCPNFTQVTIPNSVTSIGESAFANCEGLTSVTIPNSVTSIGNQAFWYCTGLTSIAIPNSVTSIGNHAFYYCTGLTSITIPSSVTNIGTFLLCGCNSLTTIVVENGNEKYDSRDNCNAIITKTDITIGNVTTPANTLIAGCKASVIPNTVTSIGNYAFQDCSGLTTVTIPSSVTSIGSQAFYDCNGLTTVTIGSGVTSIAFIAFQGCTSVTDVYCYANPANLTWDGSEDFKSYNNSNKPNCHVNKVSDWATFSSVNVNFVEMAPSYQGYCGLSTVNGGQDVSWKLYGNGLLVINGAGAMANWENSENVPWNSYKASITSVEIGNGVTSIGANAFSSCSGFTSIAIPAQVTSIGAGAFNGCTGLTSVTIPAQVTNIGADAFKGCTGITTVTFPVKVTGIGSSAFNGCSSLASVYVMATTPPALGQDAFAGNATGRKIYVLNEVTYKAADGWSSYLSDIEAMSGIASGECGANGNNCTYTLYENGQMIIRGTGAMADYPSINTPWHSDKSSITSIVIEDGVTRTGVRAFEGCSNLSSVTFGSDVTTIGEYSFAGLDKLTSVTIPSNVTNIDPAAFLNCYGLTSLIIESGVTTIGNSAFYNCSGLTTIDIPSTVTSIGNIAFGGCHGLTSVTIPSSVTSIGVNPFENCFRLNTIVVESGNEKYDSRDNCNAIIDKATNTLITGCKTTVIPNSVKSIGEKAFEYCSGLASITIPSSVTTIGEYAFDGCNGLTAVTICSGVTSIGEGAFQCCNYLTSITIPYGVTSIGSHAFEDCLRLTSVTCWAISVPTLGDNAFYDTPYDVKIYVPSVSVNAYKAAAKWNTYANKIEAISPTASGYCGSPTQTDVSWTLYGNGLLVISGTGAMADYTSGSSPWYSYRSSIKTVVIDDGVTTIGNYAFYNHTGLTSVTIPNSVTNIGGNAFNGCSSLTSIAIPNSVTSIGGSALSSCSSLTSVTIPSRVTSIGINVFNGCSGLTSVTIPNSVTNIETTAFEGCTSLTSITIPSSVKTLVSNAFANCSNLTSVTIGSGVGHLMNAVFQGCTKVANVYCYANPANLTWGHGDDDFNSNQKPICHVADASAWPCTNSGDKFYNVNVTFDGDLLSPLTAHAAEGANWSTYYNSAADMKVDDNTKVYKATVNGNSLTLTEMTSGIIKAGQAAILKSTNGNISMTINYADNNDVWTDNDLKGVDATTIIAGSAYDGKNIYTLANESGLGFYKFTGTTLGANKAFLALDAVVNNAREFRFSLDDETTAVFDLNNKEESIKNSWYTLDGRKLNGEPKQRGIYVKNGRKIIVK